VVIVACFSWMPPGFAALISDYDSLDVAQHLSKSPDIVIDQYIEHHRASYAVEKYHQTIKKLMTDNGKLVPDYAGNDWSFYTVALTNTSNRSLDLQLFANNAMQNEVVVQLASLDENLKLEKLLGTFNHGARIPHAKRTNGVRYPVIPVTVAPSETVGVFVQINENFIEHFGLDLMEADHFPMFYAKRNQQDVGFLVLLWVLAAVVMARYWVTKDPMYSLVVAMLVANSFMLLTRTGYASVWFPSTEFFQHYMASIGVSMAGVFALLMVIEGLEWKRLDPAKYRWRYVWWCVTAVATIGFLLDWYVDKTYVMILGITFVCMVPHVVMDLVSALMDERSHRTRLYLMAWVPLAVVLLLCVGTMVGMAPTWLLSSRLIEATFLLHGFSVVVIWEYSRWQSQSVSVQPVGGPSKAS